MPARKKSPPLSREAQAVLTALSRLTMEDLSVVIRRAEILRATLTGRQRAPVNTAEHDHDWLMDGIYHVLSERGLSHTVPPQSRLHGLSQYPTYRANRPAVEIFMDRACVNLQQAERGLMAVFAGRAYLDYLRDRYRHHGISAILQHIHELPEAVDAAYPGYVQSGLLPALLKQRREELLTSGE